MTTKDTLVLLMTAAPCDFFLFFFGDAYKSTYLLT